MSEIIDFNSRFTSDYLSWCKSHPEIAGDEKKLESAFPKQYQKWYSSPKKWLNGKSPNEYFEEIDDIQVYTSMMINYIEEEIDLPDPLITCLVDRGDALYPLIRNILFLDDESISKDALSDVRAYIISLITQLKKEHPLKRYVELLLASEEADLLTSELFLAFEEAEDSAYVRKLLLDAYPLSEGYAKECLLDLLCGFPDDDGEVYMLLVNEFRSAELETAFLAELAEKLGNEDILPYLREEFADDGQDYFTYTALRYAIEALSGEELPEKDFTGDRDFDAFLTYQAKEEEKN